MLIFYEFYCMFGCLNPKKEYCSKRAIAVHLISGAANQASLFERGSTYVEFKDDPKLRSEVKMMHSKLNFFWVLRSLKWLIGPFVINVKGGEKKNVGCHQ